MRRSEPLTFERADWVEIPSQSCIVITPRVRFASPPSACSPTLTDYCSHLCAQINLLRYPIVNEFFQPSATSHRADGFARAKGYRWARPQAVEAN